MEELTTKFVLPGIVPWSGISPGTGLRYADPNWIALRDGPLDTVHDLAIDATIPPVTGDEQGSLYRFPRSWAEQYSDAWQLVGWDDLAFDGAVRFPTNSGLRDGNANPWTPYYSFSGSIAAPVDDLYWANSCIITDGPVIGHAGHEPTPDGSLLSNCGMSDTLGNWKFPSPVNVPGTPIFSEVVDTINIYNVDGSGSLVGTRDARLEVFLIAYGNTSCARYKRYGGDGSWLYVSICHVTLVATLSLDDGVFGILAMPDGSTNPDRSLFALDAPEATMTTDIVPIPNMDKDLDPVEGSVSLEGFSPNMDMFRLRSPPGGQTFKVPWTESGVGDVDTDATGEFQDVNIAFTTIRRSVKPEFGL